MEDIRQGVCPTCRHNEIVERCSSVPIGEACETRIITGPEPAGPYR